MNTLLLQPADVLFFRDGRPMSGSLSGHGAAWPLPTVTNAALHAALHRALVDGKIKDDSGKPVKVHGHDHHRRNGERLTDVRKFGSLLTAGPFPVINGSWHFPRPLDAGKPASTMTTFLPLKRNAGESKDIPWPILSSLAKPLKFATANTERASKETPAQWWSNEMWGHYLGGADHPEPLQDEASQDDRKERFDYIKTHFLNDTDFADTESTYGIGIDSATGTQDGESFYSAHYLRLRENCRLGLLASADDKIDGNSSNNRDLIQTVFPNSNSRTAIIAGGQQRVCSVERPCDSTVTLPMGRTDGFNNEGEKFLVKWILLTPAIYPQINDHSGGWLPSWIRHTDGRVMLKNGNTGRGHREGREAWRKRVADLPSIDATLVAAIVGKSVPVTGYALANEGDPDLAGGPKPTHLAVPAGSVYYFECDDEASAKKLAAALNWHGNGDASNIRNRRSTLFGEKGFGLGVCGTWSFHLGNIPGHPNT